ncbi:MAG: type III pantothenate kinase [Ruminococcus sp.]|nr:type III pantothenate kinase [Candidatus Copronaster equi]
MQSDIGSGLEVIECARGQVGADLAAVSIGAIEKYSLPCFILDLGTATKIILLDENGMFRGCTISAGVRISTNALSSGTSQLPAISLVAPETSIGTNTVDCIKSGTIFGTAAMLDGLTKRMEKEFGKKINTVIATGGYAKEIVKHCEREIIYDENLIIYGLKKIYEKRLMDEKN